MKWLCLLILSGTPIIVNGQNAGYIIDQYYKAVSGGDVNNWKKIHSAYIESNSFYSQKKFDGNIDVTSPQDHSLKDIRYRIWPDSSVLESYKDTVLTITLYHVGKNHLLLMKGSPAMKVNPGVYEPFFEFDPVIVQRAIAKSKTVDTSAKELYGVKYHDVRVVTKDLVWHFYFNTINFLLEYWSNSQEDEKNPTLTKLFNYRKVDNYLIPYSEMKLKNDLVFFSSTIKKITLNDFIDRDKFKLSKK